MGKIKKKLMQTKHSRGQTDGRPNAKLCFSLFLFFFSFCPLIGHQKNEKGSGRYRRRKERKREKKKERGGGRKVKSMIFLKCCVVYFK